MSNRSGAQWLAALACFACSKNEPVKTGRPRLELDGTTWQVLSGSWKVDGNAVVGEGGHLQSLRDMTDGSIEIDVETPTPSEPIVGLGFRYTVASDDPAHMSGYVLRFSSRGFNVFRAANDFLEPMNPEIRGMSPSSILSPTKNHFVVRLAGASCEIEANGTSLFTFSDAAHPGGHVDLYVESKGAPVRFSGFKMGAP